MIPSARLAANLFAVAILLAVAGCQQQAADTPASDPAANNNVSDELANLQQITLAVTGMT